MLQTVTITVEGLVQGVYYRQSARAKAIESGLGGEVRNKPDGTVHIIATGTESQLQQLIDWCHCGPEQAIVTRVSVEKIPLQSFRNFTIIRNV
jgi:acylphosphatase